jgi:hypothetical protein
MHLMHCVTRLRESHGMPFLILLIERTAPESHGKDWKI